MSAQAILTLASWTLESTTEDIDPGVMAIFRPRDKCVQQIHWHNRELLEPYVEADIIDDYLKDGPFALVQYRCSANVARDRLELMGFTYDLAKAAFQAGLQNDVHRYVSYDNSRPCVQEETLDALKAMTFDSWLAEFRRIREDKVIKGSLERTSVPDKQTPLLRHMLASPYSFYGFPWVDCRHSLRVMLDEVADTAELVYDLTDLAIRCLVERPEDLVTWAEHVINENFILDRRVIVLTEGDKDKEVLERALLLLYPHLSDYFHFFDFNGQRLGGGAAQLSNLVRAFAAADIKHRVIALFDNDTAARASVSNLDLSRLPQNIVVRHYPSLPIARHYPTRGPSGEVWMDVNGLAGGLELYLGRDVLLDSHARLSPVQWSGYDHRLQRYQGAVLGKDRIFTQFINRLSRCEENPDEIDAYDWDGVKAIINTVLTAFHDVDAGSLIEEVAST